jgi:lysophospholipase L1-like esterase
LPVPGPATATAHRLAALWLLLCGSAVPVSARDQAAAPPHPMRVISGNVPAFASSYLRNLVPSNANSDVYDVQDSHSWVSASMPAWIAYDLSAVPPSQRAKVDVVWINCLSAYECSAWSGGLPLGLPVDYTIEGNASPAATPPMSGWVSLVQVTNNVFKSRQHVVDLSGFNWVRMSVTRVAGSSTVHLMHLDVHDLGDSPSGNPEDSWIHFGDSITAVGLNYFEHRVGSQNDFSFASLVHDQLPDRFPAQEDGGLGGTKIQDAVDHIDEWLAVFPGRYVGISYGTNDASQGTPPDRFYASYATVVQRVLDAGKVPVVPTIPWGKTVAVQTYVPALNLEIAKLYAAFPRVVPGPDLWTLFQANPSLIQDGGVHPTSEGCGRMKEWWAQAMLWNVYGARTLSLEPKEDGLALAVALRAANPSRGAGPWIDFRLPTGAPASLAIFDVQGRRVFEREVGSSGPGHHSLALGRGLTSGLYLVRLRQGAASRDARFTVLR